jgi:hypothetical protein
MCKPVAGTDDKGIEGVLTIQEQWLGFRLRLGGDGRFLGRAIGCGGFGGGLQVFGRKDLFDVEFDDLDFTILDSECLAKGWQMPVANALEVERRRDRDPGETWAYGK